MKHKDIISGLSLDEKCYLLSGRDLWTTYGFEGKGVPSIWMSDGPHGLRKEQTEAGTEGRLGI